VHLGVATSCFGQISLPEAMRAAGELGFESVEIDCPPLRGASSWFQQNALAAGSLDGPGRDALLATLEKAGLKPAALSYRTNFLETDPAKRDAALTHLGKVIEVAGTLGIPVVSILVGRDPAATLGDSIAEFARRVRPAVEQAEKSGVSLAVENCPMIGWQAEDMPGNAAFSAELWEKIFTHLRSPALGLAFNPADLAWVGADPLGLVTDYFEKIVHIHAQDVEILDLRRQDCTVLRPSGGWWRYRLPGLGIVDWRRFADRLLELGYEGSLCVRHEDPVWLGSLEKVKTGLGLARRHLVQYLP
jgi:sugar phosphate isomerase/epimerase